MKKKLTDWISLDNTPEREGVYQVRVFNEVDYSLWSGTEWMRVHSHLEDAEQENNRSHSMYNGQGNAWRGLARRPR